MTRPLHHEADRVMRATARYYDLSPDDLRSPHRYAELVTPRHVGMYLCRQLTTASYPAIARVFDRTDHTTVMFALRKVERRMAEDAGWREEVARAAVHVSAQVMKSHNRDEAIA